MAGQKASFFSPNPLERTTQSAPMDGLGGGGGAGGPDMLEQLLQAYSAALNSGDSESVAIIRERLAQIQGPQAEYGMDTYPIDKKFPGRPAAPAARTYGRPMQPGMFADPAEVAARRGPGGPPGQR